MPLGLVAVAGWRGGLWLAGVLVVVGCSSLADARSSSGKEGAPRPPVNYAILWLSRVTEKENGAVVLLSSSVCLSPLSCESLQRDRAFIGHTSTEGGAVET
jgi:hypothetical protein